MGSEGGLVVSEAGLVGSEGVEYKEGLMNSEKYKGNSEAGLVGFEARLESESWVDLTGFTYVDDSGLRKLWN